MGTGAKGENLKQIPTELGAPTCSVSWPMRLWPEPERKPRVGHLATEPPQRPCSVTYICGWPIVLKYAFQMFLGIIKEHIMWSLLCTRYFGKHFTYIIDLIYSSKQLFKVDAIPFSQMGKIEILNDLHKTHTTWRMSCLKLLPVFLKPVLMLILSCCSLGKNSSSIPTQFW